MHHKVVVKTFTSDMTLKVNGVMSNHRRKSNMAYQEQESDVSKIATFTVRNIPHDVDKMIAKQACIFGKSKSDSMKHLCSATVTTSAK